MVNTAAVRHPGGLQVACPPLGSVPSGRVCQVSGDPLKVPSEGPTECTSCRVTCKHAYCVSAWGECMVVTPHPPHPSLSTPSPLNRPGAAQTHLSLSSCVISRPPHAEPSCQASQFQDICRVSSSDRKGCLLLVFCGRAASFPSSGIFDDRIQVFRGRDDLFSASVGPG